MKNMVTNNEWDAVDPIDAKITVLATKIQELESETKPKAGTCFPPWRTNNVGPEITRDGKT